MGRLSFSEAFNPYIQNTANLLSRHFMQSGEDERAKAEQLKYQQEQAGILNQLVAGGKRGKIDSLSMGTIPFSQQEQTGLISQADDNTLQRYKILSEMDKPKDIQQGTVKVGNKFYKESSQYKNLPEGNVLWEEPTAKITEDFVDAGSIEGLEQFKDYKVNRIVTENPDGTKTVKYGQPFTWKKQNININTGQMDDDLSKETTKILNDYQSDQQDIMDKLDAVNRGETVYDVTPFGFKTVVSKKDLETRLSSVNAQYSAFIKRNAGLDTIKDYNDINSQLDPTDPQAQPKKWKTILDYYKSGKRSESWFKEQLHLFSADYGYNPISKFGIK